MRSQLNFQVQNQSKKLIAYTKKKWRFNLKISYHLKLKQEKILKNKSNKRCRKILRRMI